MRSLVARGAHADAARDDIDEHAAARGTGSACALSWHRRHLRDRLSSGRGEVLGHDQRRATHAAIVVRSDDRGTTWRDAHVPLPAPFSPDMGSRAHVLFVYRDDVVIELDRPTGLYYAVAFVASRDGGRTFTTRVWPDSEEFPDPNGTGAPFLATVHDAVHWTVVLYDATDQSDDAGRTWRRFALPAGLEARGVSWSTIDTGSIIATTPAGRTRGLHTVDGGKSWVVFESLAACLRDADRAQSAHSAARGRRARRIRRGAAGCRADR